MCFLFFSQQIFRRRKISTFNTLLILTFSRENGFISMSEHLGKQNSFERHFILFFETVNMAECVENRDETTEIADALSLEQSTLTGMFTLYRHTILEEKQLPL